jgi:hypothetical protein
MTSSNGDLNVPLLITENAPVQMAAAIKRRDELIAEVRELNHLIAVLQTHLQVQDSDMKREDTPDVQRRSGDTLRTTGG